MMDSCGSLPSAPSSWLITGGCGFIGTSLIRKLLENGLAGKIRVLDNLSAGTREDLSSVCDFIEINPEPQACRSPNFSKPLREFTARVPDDPGTVELVIGDIRNQHITTGCCAGIDIIIHLAANTGVAPSVENPRHDMECNVIGTVNMLEGARQHGVERFIFASSGAPVGEIEPPIHEDLAPHPVSPYGASKLAGEGYCSAYFRTFGIKTTSLRFGNVYGPLSLHKDSVVAKFIKRALAGKVLQIYGDGSQTRDFIFIEDLLEAILCASKTNLGGETFQIASARETTIEEIALMLKQILNKKKADLNVRIEHGKPRLGDVKRNFSDTSKARKYLAWKSKWPLEKGLTATIDWFLDSACP